MSNTIGVWEIRETVYSDADDRANSNTIERTVSTFTNADDLRTAYETTVQVSRADDTAFDVVIQPDSVSWRDDTNGSYVVWKFVRVSR